MCCLSSSGGRLAVPGDLVLRLRLLLTSPAGAECIDGTELNEKNYKPQSESSNTWENLSHATE